VTWGSCCRFK